MKSYSKQNQVQVFDFGPETLEEKTTNDINECVPYKHTDSVTWINIDSVPPIAFLEELRLGFDLHPVIESDILTVNQRPKVEILEKYIFLRLKMVRFDEHAKKIRHEQVSMVVASRFLITFQEGVTGDVFEPVRALIRSKDHRIRVQGTDYLCYELVDAMVSGFFGVLEHCSSHIDDLEQEILRDAHPRSVRALGSLKRELLNLRKAAWPLRELITLLERANSPLVRESTQIYFRDVFAKLVQVTESIEIYREMVSSLQDVYHLRVNSRTNEVMKFLTVITTIFMPLTFFAGFYGMNFSHLPGIDYVYGPLFSLAFMFALAIGMVLYFRYKEWL